MVLQARGLLTSGLQKRMAARTVRLVLGYNAGEPTSEKEAQLEGAAESPFNIPGRRGELSKGDPATALGR